MQTPLRIPKKCSSPDVAHNKQLPTRINAKMNLGGPHAYCMHTDRVRSYTVNITINTTSKSKYSTSATNTNRIVE